MFDSLVAFGRQLMSDNWLAWFYQYTIGGLLFFVALYLSARGGFFLFMGAHGFWIFGLEGWLGK